MQKFLSLIAIACLLCACSQPAEQTANYRVVPLPHEITLTGENEKPFVLNSSTKIVAADDVVREAQFLQEYVADLTGQKLSIVADAEKNVIKLYATLESENPEAYTINVTPEEIVINGATPAGTFYGVQTLRKSIPAKEIKSNVVFPAVAIADQPRFGYRGTLLDVARHPMEPDSVKAFIDMIAMHNVNRLHWHLTDDQGWRIEIKKYPGLTEVGSHRDGTMFERNWDVYDTIPVDGYYTQAEARDIIAYAKERHIEIIPEIDLPGHMVAALTAYPELGCTGGPYEVWKKWGISEDLLCAGNDSVYAFLDGVLTEICDIFPSEYIHIGGDECPKTRWKECPKCQAKIKELGLKADANSSAEAKLQNYVMAQAMETLKRYGRKVIGWDEILEGGAPDDAIIMSWRGVKGAYEAAHTGHDAILTPTDYCYFDYCQSTDLSTEPVGIGGYLPVKKVYSFQPIPDTYTEEEAQHILGVQANLWREYIKTLSHAQYMELPRLAALSEVQWDEDDMRDYADFLQRVQQLINHYQAAGYNYARHIYDINADYQSIPEEGVVVLTLSTGLEQPIYYTLDGTEPTTESAQYTEPLKFAEAANVRAISVGADGKPSHEFKGAVEVNKATFKPLTIGNEPTARFGGDPSELNNGVLGSTYFTDPEWMGFEGKGMIATVDLGEPQDITEAGVRMFVDSSNWLYDTRKLTVEASADGQTYFKVAEEEYPAMAEHEKTIRTRTLTFDPVKAKYVRITAAPENAMPEWRGNGAGKPALIFVDEVIVK